MERKSSQPPRLTSTPRPHGRATIDMNDSFYSMSPINPTQHPFRKTQSLIPVNLALEVARKAKSLLPTLGEEVSRKSVRNFDRKPIEVLTNKAVPDEKAVEHDQGGILKSTIVSYDPATWQMAQKPKKTSISLKTKNRLSLIKKENELRTSTVAGRVDKDIYQAPDELSPLEATHPKIKRKTYVLSKKPPVDATHGSNNISNTKLIKSGLPSGGLKKYDETYVFMKSNEEKTLIPVELDPKNFSNHSPKPVPSNNENNIDKDMTKKKESLTNDSKILPSAISSHYIPVENIKPSDQLIEKDKSEKNKELPNQPMEKDNAENTEQIENKVPNEVKGLSKVTVRRTTRVRKTSMIVEQKEVISPEILPKRSRGRPKKLIENYDEPPTKVALKTCGKRTSKKTSKEKITSGIQDKIEIIATNSPETAVSTAKTNVIGTEANSGKKGKVQNSKKSSKRKPSKEIAKEETETKTKIKKQVNKKKNQLIQDDETNKIKPEENIDEVKSRSKRIKKSLLLEDVPQTLPPSGRKRRAKEQLQSDEIPAKIQAGMVSRKEDDFAAELLPATNIRKSKKINKGCTQNKPSSTLTRGAVNDEAGTVFQEAVGPQAQTGCDKKYSKRQEKRATLVHSERFGLKQWFGMDLPRETSQSPGICTQTMLHIEGFVMTGYHYLQPKSSISRASTNTTYLVLEGEATVKIKCTTKHISFDDQSSSFFIPKHSDFSITNNKDSTLKLFFTKFNG